MEKIGNINLKVGKTYLNVKFISWPFLEVLLIMFDFDFQSKVGVTYLNVLVITSQI